jgi:hyperosmotically inducible periplasmic protein
MTKSHKKQIALLSLIQLGILVMAPSIAWSKQKTIVEGSSYLVREVTHELRMLPYYTVFDNLEFKVDGYNVELMGEVVNPVLKSDAERVVKKIEGVEKVTNNIKVLPVSQNDEHLRRELFRAIYGEPSLNRYALQAIPPIHIIVDNGHVTLVGVVANEADKNIANIRANGVPGVFSVKNDLRVEK